MLQNLNDRAVGNLLQLLSSVQVNSDGDKFLWKPKKDGQFTVKSFYEMLMGSNEPGLEDLPFK